MASWNELLNELSAQPDDKKAEWIKNQQLQALSQVATLQQQPVIFYASAFLQKPAVPPDRTSITREDLNGVMAAVRGLDPSHGLTLMIHTPGGDPNAAATLISYLRTKFNPINVVVPALAMSAGTMIALSGNAILMGRQSQLGPTDPQLIVQVPGGTRVVSAHAIRSQFEHAREDIAQHPENARAWVPILQAFGPALYQQAQDAIAYTETTVAEWLERWMFRRRRRKNELAVNAAKYFNSPEHRSHGRRIDRQECRSQNLVVRDLERDQAKQDAVLHAYHIATMIFERGPSTKFIVNNQGVSWVKSYQDES